MSYSPNRSKVASAPAGTVLGLGTIGLGESFGRMTDKQIEEEGIRNFWANWNQTRQEWQKADEGRSRKVVEELAKDKAKRAAEASRQRMVEIDRMQRERKLNEEAKRREHASEAAEQRSLNKMVNEAIRKDREEGIARRKDDRAKELEELHRERELLLEMSEIERQADAEAKREHIEEMRRWHQACKERSKAEAEKRLNERKEKVAKLKDQKEHRDVQVKEWRSGIVQCKSILVKEVASTHKNGKYAVLKATDQKTKKAGEMRDLVKQEKVIAIQRTEEHLDQRSKVVKELQARTQAARQAYEDERRLAKEALKRQVAEQKEAAMRLRDDEERERLEEQAVHIANVRALVNRRRTESRATDSTMRSLGRKTASPIEPDSP